MQPQKARPRLESEIISADAQSLPKFIRLQPKSVDQIRKRGLLLPPAWAIQEKAWERLTPILQHADKFPALKLRHHPFVRHEGYADAVNSRANHRLHVINDQRSNTAALTPRTVNTSSGHRRRRVPDKGNRAGSCGRSRRRSSSID